MVLLLLLVVAAAVTAGLAIGWSMARQGLFSEPSRHDEAFATTIDRALDALRHEQADAMHSAVNTILAVASSKFGDQLEAGQVVIDRERDSMTHQVETVNAEIQRVSSLVAELQKESALQAGQLSSGLEQAFRVTSTLAASTQSLERALASPKARGQWGERMAQDVLRSAGFVEGVSYLKQTKLRSGGIPDYTFLLPHDHLVHMDVKFPIDNYRRWLDADDEPSRVRYSRQFQRDVRQRIKELTDRAYVDPETTVDYVLLFVPNESVYSFLHEHDAAIIDHAIAQKVVLCSPVTLFAVLAVIRQSVDNFLVERRSDDILGALTGLREQWERWSEPMEKMRRGLCSAQKAFEDLDGPRARQFERQLEKLEAVRDARALALDAPSDGEPSVDPEAPVDPEPSAGRRVPGMPPRLNEFDGPSSNFASLDAPALSADPESNVLPSPSGPSKKLRSAADLEKPQTQQMKLRQVV